MNISTNKTTFYESFIIQKRVIFALIMREIITRYGRHNIGFLWLFAEPMIFTLGVTALWTATKGIHGSSLPIIAFAITGYSSVLLWRNTPNRCSQAVSSNTGLLYHRNVKIIDLMLSRIILEVSGITISFVGLSIGFIAIGLMDLPADIFTMIIAWFLLVWFTIGLSFIIGYVSETSEVFDRLWHAITYLLFGLSGAGFLVDWLPPTMQKIVLLLPMVHGSEMLRHGYYGNTIITYESPTYLISSNLILTFLGLILLRKLHGKITHE